MGDVKATLAALLPMVKERNETRFLEKHLAETEEFAGLLKHYVEKGPDIKPIRPEYLTATLSELASDDAMFFADTGTPCIWLARHIKGGRKRRLFGHFLGPPWPVPRRTPLERSWRIRAVRQSHSVAMADSQCWL